HPVTVACRLDGVGPSGGESRVHRLEALAHEAIRDSLRRALSLSTVLPDTQPAPGSAWNHQLESFGVLRRVCDLATLRKLKERCNVDRDVGPLIRKCHFQGDGVARRSRTSHPEQRARNLSKLEGSTYRGIRIHVFDLLTEILRLDSDGIHQATFRAEPIHDNLG